MVEFVSKWTLQTHPDISIKVTCKKIAPVQPILIGMHAYEHGFWTHCLKTDLKQSGRETMPIFACDLFKNTVNLEEVEA